MVRKILIPLLLAFGLLAAACSSGAAESGVASLEGASTSDQTDVSESDTASDEENLLAFTVCLRDEGLDVDDPAVDDEGNLQAPRPRDTQGMDREVARAAFDACSDLLDEVTFGLSSEDLTETQDNFLAFAVCMRENGYDMPDPDFSTFGQPGPRGQVFGERLDRDDPTFQSALVACETIFEDALRIPGLGGGQG